VIESQKSIKPKSLKRGDTIGVFTPSSPAYIDGSGLFENGVKNLERIGFKVKLGSLTSKRANQGYRSGTAKDRAEELMELIRDDSVNAVMSTIGGYNSSSMIEHLDFEEIRKQRKIFCGYSDVTSLHLAILKYANLRTVYGPSVICWFGDWPTGVEQSEKWFLEAVQNEASREREIFAPAKWSNHMRSWSTGEWKTVPRDWHPNTGWKGLSFGTAEARVLAVNLNTLLSAAGTAYWPETKGRILVLEEMETSMSKTERALQHLKMMGVFEDVKGLVLSKPEVFHQQKAPLTYEDLVLEVVGPRNYPIVCNFDCGHTVPMISIGQDTRIRIEAEPNSSARFTFLESMVEGL
jgi:muramoyltetrapeptide carboxypeptidase